MALTDVARGLKACHRPHAGKVAGAPDAAVQLEGAGDPFASGVEHLWYELARVDQLVRAQTVIWRATLAATKPQHLWGMIHVTDAEVDAYLRSPFLPPGCLPAELAADAERHWRRAEDLARTIEERRAVTPESVDLRLARLTATFGLSPLERDLLLVALLPELDGRYRRLFGYLQDDASRTRPTVELALEILRPQALTPDLGRAALDAGAPLARYVLLAVEAESPGEPALAMRSLRVDDRISAFLLGGDRLDGRLAGVAAAADPLAWDQLSVEPRTVARLEGLADRWRGLRQAREPGPVVFLFGAYGSGARAAARALCTAADTPLVVATVDAASASPEGWQRIVDLAYREAALVGAAVYWSGCQTLLAPAQPPQPFEILQAAAEAFPGWSFLESDEAWDPCGRFRDRPFLRLDFPAPGYDRRRRLWRRHLPPAADFEPPAPDRDALAELLANSFQLNEGRLLDALATARGEAAVRRPGSPRLTLQDLHDGCRRQSGKILVSFARRIEPRTELTFDDLILPAPNSRQLRELRDRIRHRSRVYTDLGFERRLTLGKGLIALFTGASGTGKTMAAELLAREQGVDLYKVDLSAVVSKYVGETEKNLSRVFAEAEYANAIIFFDEADALFGKRGEVKEARDRWANIEVNYLLQRVEEYAGVVILASNLRQNIDEAFLRRIHVIVGFPSPDADARFRIWRGMFPGGVERPADEELRILAEQFRLAGGNIKNVVLDAAFRALGDAGGEAPAITLKHLVLSTAREYQKLGRPITRGEFTARLYGWVEEEIL